MLLHVAVAEPMRNRRCCRLVAESILRPAPFTPSTLTPSPQSTWQPVLINMMVGGLLVWTFRRFGAPGVPHPLWKPPPAGSFKWLEQLQALDKVWHYLMTLTTFTLSFFFNQSCESLSPRRQPPPRAAAAVACALTARPAQTPPSTRS